MLLDAEQRRRLIGNDVLVIFFQDTALKDCNNSGNSNNDNHNSNDGNTSFRVPITTSKLTELGQFPQVYGVVRPYYVPATKQTVYKIGFVTRAKIPFYGPEIPKDHLFDPGTLKEFLLTKIANGYLKSIRSPPLNKLFEPPRQIALAELVNKYSSERTRKGKNLWVIMVITLTLVAGAVIGWTHKPQENHILRLDGTVI